MTTATQIRAQRGPQERFLASVADFVLFGGAAGGGKSHALLLEPLRHIHNPNFGAVIFRRTYPQIANEGGLWDSSAQIYPLLGAVPRESTMEWRFPSGATIRFAHMQHESNRFDWQGSQLPFIGWDEISHFLRQQVFYMLSRSRSTCGVRPYIRATTNPVPPDDPIGGWLHEFVGWYIDDAGYAIPERSGVVRWFVNVDDKLAWATQPDELRAKFPGIEPKSFTFIRSMLTDNPALLAADPGYLANLMALPLVEQEQLLRGNWRIAPAAGKIFNRAWFETVDAAPAGGWQCRAWDLAASEKKVAGDDPDYTAGVLMRRVGDVYYVLDCVEERLGPAHVDTLLRNTAAQDTGTTWVRWEMEGGASGKRDNRYIASLLAGWDARGVRPQGDKVTRARGLSAQAYAGNVKLVRGAWNKRWLDHMHGQPDLAHDDIMDASALAFNTLAKAHLMAVGGSYQG